MATLKDAKIVSEYLVEKMNPISIVVFGSVSKKGEGADIDLLIVTDDYEKDLKKLDLETSKILRPFNGLFPIDHFVIPKSVIIDHFLKGSPFLRLIQKEGRCLYMKDSIKEWFAQAKEDLAMAECLLNNGYFRGACYHSQQTIEKSLKGALIKEGWDLEKTHSIRLLTSIANRYNISKIISEDDMDFIDSIYRGRCPGEEGLLPTHEPIKDDAVLAVKIANETYSQLFKKVYSNSY